jgi:hypothetical protein
VGKGYTFEIYVVDKLRELFRSAIENNPVNRVFRIMGSGRNKNSTKSGQDSLLEGDVSVELSFLPKNFLIECKHHKSHTIEKSISVRKEWLDQARQEAENNKRWSAVAIRFKHVSPKSNDLKQYSWYGEDGNSVHYIVPEKHFLEILKYFELNRDEKGIYNHNELSNFSNNQLLEELQKRLEQNQCVNDSKTGEKKEDLKIS